MTTGSEHYDEIKTRKLRGSNETLALDSFRETTVKEEVTVKLLWVRQPLLPSAGTSQLYTEGRKFKREIR
jgi:hypothetical protein